jgi:eukaryotic-like serine/threonine-protein kinase
VGSKPLPTEGDADATEFAATVQSLPAPDEFAGHVSEPGLDAADDPTLSHIGRYALKRQLGQGGLGTVYEAWDPLLSRTVAVKTLQFELDTPSRVSLDGLFLNEARTAAGLNHPGIVTIFDAGLSAHGVYIAMERLRGRDLRQSLAEGWKPSATAAAQLARRVAEALAYAHARGVVHCDIKPANIFLSRRDKPKLLDFGIARVAHGAALPALDGLVAGSPHYLAPEQIEGGAVDARTDLYSLGVVLYELLAGRKAFDGASLDEITRAVLEGRATPVHQLRADVPASLSRIVARAMARSPDDRHASAVELVQDLRRWYGEQPAEADAAAPRPAQDRTRTMRRIGLAGVAVALAAGIAAIAWRRPQPAPAVPIAAARPATVPIAAAAPAAAASAGAAAVALAAAPPPSRHAPVAAHRKPAPRPLRVAAAPAAAPAASGLVQLAISPWGEVDVDGRPAGVTPPLAQLSLSAGRHRITVRNADFPPLSTTVDVDPDQPVTVRHRFGS